ncbi:methyl-accepting chemotaxis protein [Gemmata sp.]|uniref:methyl-accepting chemotaxis protein n=1 Tax=Gemmata sp. TaxID=1914242 RepID=UPI003F6E98BC
MARSRLLDRLSVSRLPLWQKCALIAVPFLLPIAALLYAVVDQSSEQIATVHKEQRGLEYLRPLRQLAFHLAAHRDLSARVATGDKAAEADRSRVAGLVEESIREVDQADQRLGAEFKTPETKRWQKVKDEWAALRAAGPAAADATFQRQTDLITAALDLSTDVWEYSTLALDPVAETYYLQDIMIARSVAGTEDLAQLRTITAAAARRPGGALADDERIRVNVLIGQIEQTRNAIDKEVRNAVRANAALKGRLEGAAEDYRSKVDTFLGRARTALGGEANERAGAAELAAAGADAVVASGKLYDAYEPPLGELLAARAAQHRRVTAWLAGGTAAALVLVGLVVLLVTRAIVRQVSGLNDLFAKIEAGDFKSRAEVTSADELGRMARSLNAMLDKTLVLVQSKDEKEEIQRSIMNLLNEVSAVGQGDLRNDVTVSADITGAIADSFNYTIEALRKIINRVQATTARVSTSATEIHSSAEHLAGGAEDQAEQIVSVSAALDEMATSIQQVSENAATSSAVAQQALLNARQGNSAVRGTIDGMNRIREQAQETAKRIKRLGETTQEIGQIVQLIDDIADRTGILALNASIQAAAAGEAGRTFAVVAEEVERLAVRSTDATKKIAALVRAIQVETNEAVAAMERSIQEVVGGSKVANQAGQSLAEIETVSVKLAELIQSISHAAKQQARGSEALARSMADINEITHNTAAGTKQTAASVDDLAKLADELRSSLSTFKLPAGAAEVAQHQAAGGQANGRRDLAV